MNKPSPLFPADRVGMGRKHSSCHVAYLSVAREVPKKLWLGSGKATAYCSTYRPRLSRVRHLATKRSTDPKSNLALGCPGGNPDQNRQLDQDNDGVFDREKWIKWWVQRWKATAIREEDPSEKKSGRGDSTAGRTDGEGEQESGGGAGGERITELAERARQARRRAGTDIHTAAWRGDLALVKVSVPLCLPCQFAFHTASSSARPLSVSVSCTRATKRTDGVHRTTAAVRARKSTTKTSMSVILIPRGGAPPD